MLPNQVPVDGKAAVATQAQAVDLSCQWKKVMLSHRIQKGDEELICVSQPNLFCWDPQILDELDFVLSVHKINVVAVVILAQIFVQVLR